MRLLLDVNPMRVSMVGTVEVVWGSHRKVVEGLRLDTGLGADLVAPSTAICSEDFPENFWLDENFEGFGGTAPASVFEATLVFGEPPQEQKIEVRVIENCPHWFVGMPILQHFDLLLRPVAADDVHRPRMER